MKTQESNIDNENQSDKIFRELVDLIIMETSEVKLEYIRQVRIWAKSDYERSIQRLNNYTQNQSDLFKNDRKAYYREQKWYHSHTYYYRITLDHHIQKEVIGAEQHYENAVHTIAQRVIKKDLDLKKIRLSHTKLKQFFDVYITDGEKTLHARTIVASGPVQRPHYRYIIT